MESKYKEIVKLHEMLQTAGIEHDWLDRNELFDPENIAADHFRQRGLEPIDWGRQIIVYRADGERLVSAIEGWGTYGAENDRIEIMWEDGPDVEGWLTAEEVFGRIQSWIETR